MPTAAFPHKSQTDDCIQAIVQLLLFNNNHKNDEDVEEESSSDGLKNMETYWELDGFQHDFLKERLNVVHDEMKISPPYLSFSELQAMISVHHPRTLIFKNAFYSAAFIPAVTDVGPNVHPVGPLVDAYIPKSFIPPSTTTPRDFRQERPTRIF